MQTKQFIEQAAPKVGPSATFDMLRDAQTTALINLLIVKKLFTRAELDFQNELELTKAAQNIDKMVNAPGSPFSKQ